MQGRLQGKRLHGALLPRPRPRARHGGVQLPARRRRRHEHRRRLRDLARGSAATATCSSTSTSTRCAAPRAAGTRRRCSATSPGSTGAARSRSRRGRCSRRRSTRAAELGLRRALPAPSSSSSSSRTPTSRPGTGATTGLTPANRYNVDYSILGRRPGRAAAARDPQRDVRRRASSSRAPRASATSASTRSPSCSTRSLRTVRQPRRLQERRPRRSRPAHGKSLTFMAKFDEREGNSCHIHLSPARPRRRDGVRRRRPRGRAQRAVRPLPRRRPGHAARADLLLRAEHQLLQAIRLGELRADGGRVGSGQPHLRAARRRARCRAARREPRRPAATSTPTSRVAAMLAGGLHGIENELAARAGLRGQRLHLGQAARARRRCRRRATCSPARPSRERPSATRSSTTTSTRPTSRSRPSTPRSPTGSAREDSNDCDPPPSHPAPPIDVLRGQGPRRYIERAEGRGMTTASQTHDVINPATEEVVATVPLASLEQADEAIARARAAASGWAAVAPADRGAAAAALLRPRRRAPGGARAARGRERRAHDRQRPLGGGQRPRRPRLLLGGARAELRTPDPGRRRHRRHVPGAAGRRRRSSCRGTSRCRSPDGGSRPRSPPATPWCSSPPS